MPEPINIDNQGNIVLKINVKRFVKVAAILLFSASAWFLPIAELQDNNAARICLMIFIGAAGFWVTEAIPPFATAVMVIVLSVYLLGMPGGPLGLEDVGLSNSYQIFINPIASPVIVLFFGGFILAMGAVKHGLDIRMARALLKPFGTRPNIVLLGIILITALFSMFISNTATTAMMLAIMTPVLAQIPERDRFKKALALAVPFAANIGGMGTIIGTPPNAVAASILNGMGPEYSVNFLKWMVVGVPIMVVLLFVLWVILIKTYHPRTEKFEVLFPEQLHLTWDLVVVAMTFAVTIIMWLSEPLHHIPAAVTAMLPVLIFTVFGIIGRDDLKRLEWDVLILVAGGLTIGVAMEKSGLSQIMVNLVPLEGMSAWVLIVIFAVFTIILSNFMSNTAAANLIIPIVVAVSMNLPGLGPVVGAMTVAFMASLAMSLPVSTPPNAIAFSTRFITTREMAQTGALMSAFGLVIALLMLWALRTVFGLL